MNKQSKFDLPSKAVTEDISEIFRTNLRRILDERQIAAATISRKAGLNLRAVKDIEQKRAQSPRLSTVFKLAEALEVPPQELLGLEHCKCMFLGNLSMIEQFISSVPVCERERLRDEIRQRIEPASVDGSSDKQTLSG